MNGDETTAEGDFRPRMPRSIQDIAADIAELREEAGAAGFGFLSFVLGMALHECLTILKLAHPRSA